MSEKEDQDINNPLRNPPKYIHIEFSKRPTFMNKCARILYKIFYALFASIWFYFIPFFSIYISYAVPSWFGATTTFIPHRDDDVNPFVSPMSRFHD